MNKNIKLAVLGGDARQRYLARDLAERGFETAVWGLGGEAKIGGAVKCRDPKSALASASAIILPLPATFDGITLNSEWLLPVARPRTQSGFRVTTEAMILPAFRLTSA